MSGRYETKPEYINDIQAKLRWKECFIPDEMKPAVLFELCFFRLK